MIDRQAVNVYSRKRPVSVSLLLLMLCRSYSLTRALAEGHR